MSEFSGPIAIEDYLAIAELGSADEVEDSVSYFEKFGLSQDAEAFSEPRDEVCALIHSDRLNINQRSRIVGTVANGLGKNQSELKDELPYWFDDLPQAVYENRHRIDSTALKLFNDLILRPSLMFEDIEDWDVDTYKFWISGIEQTF